MTPLRQQMLAALQLSGKGERTQQAYVREVRLLAQFYGKAPHLLSEQELQHYFLHRKNVDGLAPASMRICYSGIRFFYQHVLKRDWHTLSLIRAQPTHRLPAVLSVEEVRRLLKAATPLHNQVSFTTVYSLGLRLHKVISAIHLCQSGHYGHSLYQCQSCGGKHRVNHSCGNRHCPQCQ
jgi:integrase/recombinase XerD